LEHPSLVGRFDKVAFRGYVWAIANHGFDNQSKPPGAATKPWKEKIVCLCAWNENWDGLGGVALDVDLLMERLFAEYVEFLKKIW